MVKIAQNGTEKNGTEKNGTEKNGTEKNGTLTVIGKKILKIIFENPEGLRALNIIKQTKISRRTVYNNLNKLQALKLVQNITPIWKLCHVEGTPLKVAQLLRNKKIQLHDFSFTIKLIKAPIWWLKRSNKLLKLNARPLRFGNNSYQQLPIDDFLIQIFTTSIIFINQKKYWGKDAYDCFIQATKDFMNTYYKIENMFNFKFFPDNIPNVSVRTQHYVKINDYLAKKYKKDGKKFCVWVDNKRRIWVDMSDPFGTEAGDKDHATEDMTNYQDLVKDVITNNPPLPSMIASNQEFITKTITDMVIVMKGIQDNQLVFDSNMKSHTKAVQGIAKGFEKFNKLLSKLEKKL